jgi:hypothetical protein
MTVALRPALTDEQQRILRAAAQRRLRVNEHGRWLIDGEARPDRRSREKLRQRGLIDNPPWDEMEAPQRWALLVPTARGADILAALEHS